MTRLRLYLDTSVLAALSDPGPFSRRESTKYFLDCAQFRNVELFTSYLALYELEVAPRAVRDAAAVAADYIQGLLDETDETKSIAAALLQHRAFPHKRDREARHVALAVASGMNAVVSWDFHAIVNMERRRGVRLVCGLLGVASVDLVSPEEALHET
jgi:predicted nucleic acid-binding protein